MGLRFFFLLACLLSFLGGWLAAVLPSPHESFLLAALMAGFLLGGILWALRRTERQIRDFLSRPESSKSLSWFTDLLDPLYEGTVHLFREKEKARNQAEETSSRFVAVLDHMEEGVVVTDLKGKILLINKAFSRFFKMEGSVRGESFGMLARKAGINDMIESVLVQRASVQKEIVFSETSPPRTWSLVGTTAKGAGMTDLYGVFLLFDLTEIRHLERVRKDFVANVSHEIRTPLTSIRGFAEALVDGAIDEPETAREFVGIILNHSQRLGDIVSDLLHLSELETGKAVLDYRTVSVSRQLGRLEELYRTIAMKKNLHFVVDPGPEGLTYEIDEGKMDLVLSNLVDNAIKYTGFNGKVTVGAHQEGADVVFEIRDTGVGIPRTDVDRVFERFYRVDRARSREMGGTGLGLAIVRHIVEILKGTVKVQSSPGEGSVFSVRVPLVQSPEGKK
ncbi:MAG: sensor histidine kinase [Leptospirales bacterium]